MRLRPFLGLVILAVVANSPGPAPGARPTGRLSPAVPTQAAAPLGNCLDVDGDGLTDCAGDCDDTNPHCTTD
jgi:hypothetical protein